MDNIQLKYTDLFYDKTCLLIKQEYINTDDFALHNLFIDNNISMELYKIFTSIKYSKWLPNEKQFRVHSYEPYSEPIYWKKKLNTLSYSLLNNPTGIIANKNENIYIFVDDYDQSCSSVNAMLVKDNDSYGNTINLSPGMNVIKSDIDNAYIFILYHVNTENKNISDFKDIDIHIEHGEVYGYYDINKHSLHDAISIYKHNTNRNFFIKSNKSLFIINNKIKEFIDFDNLHYIINEINDEIVKQQILCGIYPQYADKFNNKLLFLSDVSTDCNASNYRILINDASFKELLTCKNLENDNKLMWVLSHEIGHIHQWPINIVGCIDTSNNLFSNRKIYNSKTFKTRGLSINLLFKDFLNNVPWCKRNTWLQCRMFWQLYLYYHVLGNNTNFYSNLFNLLRNDKRGELVYNKSNNINQLDFVKKCCEASGDNLISFFRMWGFFIPVNNAKIKDNFEYNISLTAREINDTIFDIENKYTNKVNVIQYLDDRTHNNNINKINFEDENCDYSGLNALYNVENNIILKDELIYYVDGDNYINILSYEGCIAFKLFDTKQNKFILLSNSTKIKLNNNIDDIEIYAMDCFNNEKKLKRLHY